MEKSKATVGILFGGKSSEHEVSLQSALNVIQAIDREQYNVMLLSIDRNGSWFYHKDENDTFLNTDDPKKICLNIESADPISLLPGSTQSKFFNLREQKELGEIDVIFPVLHGSYGEDGTIQGLFRMLDIPFVGGDVLGSSIAMDKVISKRLLKESNLPIVDYVVLRRCEIEKLKIDYDEIVNNLGLPLFVKPANTGSSIGVSQARDIKELKEKIKKALCYDNKILIEKSIKGREIECSVLGNEEIWASIPGEIIPKKEFYSYEAKYLDEEGAELVAPASLDDDFIKEIQIMSKEAFKAVGLEGMARVDFFLDENNIIYINEINTIPGFTKISMYPRLWKHSGLGYDELIDRLLKLGLNRHKRDSSLKISCEYIEIK